MAGVFWMGDAFVVVKEKQILGKEITMKSQNNQTVKSQICGQMVQPLEGRVLFTKYSVTELGFVGAAESSSTYGFVESDFATAGSYVVGERQATSGGALTPFVSGTKKLAPGYLPVSTLYFRAAVNAVSSNGTAVGFGEYASDDSDEAIEWKKKKAEPLGPGFANGINASGEIVGTYDDSSGEPYAVIFGKHDTFLGSLGGVGGDALAVNNAGLIVGQSLTDIGELHPFLYSGGKMTDLDPNCTTGTAYAINNSNEIVGQADGMPFYFSKHKLTELPVADYYGSTAGQAVAVNDSDVIVGQDDNETDDQGYGVPAAVEWVKGKEYDLNNLISASSGVELSQAVSINNKGQIIAIGTGPDGFTDSFLLTPKA
jgi:probable HAF family extracellular repeat protein